MLKIGAFNIIYVMLFSISEVALRFSIRQLEVVRAVADLRRVSAAARRLGMAQPAVTRYLRAVEEEIGSPLFERTGKGMVPTATGEALLHRARAIAAELLAIEQDVRLAEAATATRLAIGISPAVTSVVPVAAMRMLESGLKANIVIREDVNRVLLPLLLDGELDVVVSPLPPDDMSEGLFRQVLFYNRLTIVVRRDHPLVRAGLVEPADLLRFPWVLPGRSVPARTQLETAFYNARLLPPKAMFECDSLRVSREILLCSDAVSVMASGTAHHDVDSQLLHPLDVALQFPLRPIAAVTPRWRSANRAVTEFIAALGRETEMGLFKSVDGTPNRDESIR